MLRITPLAAALLLVTACSNEPAQLMAPIELPDDQGSSGFYGIPDASSTQLLPDQSVSLPVEYGDERTAPVVDLQEQQMQSAQDAKARGDTTSYIAILNQAADQGGAQAHYELARNYTDGKLVPRDLSAATAHLEASAALGNPEAIRVLAWQLIRGDNGVTDLPQGAVMIEIAAQTSPRAQLEAGMLFGNLYQYHLNDNDKAKRYLGMAYEGGDPEAAYQLGRLHNNLGENLDAVQPLSFAAASGNSKARKLLAQIDPSTGTIQFQDHVETKPIDPENLYLRANAIVLKPNRTLEQEAHAYVLFSLALDQGYQLAAPEVNALSGVKILMDKKDPGWLERGKASSSGGASSQR